MQNKKKQIIEGIYSCLPWFKSVLNYVRYTPSDLLFITPTPSPIQHIVLKTLKHINNNNGHWFKRIKE